MAREEGWVTADVSKVVCYFGFLSNCWGIAFLLIAPRMVKVCKTFETDLSPSSSHCPRQNFPRVY